MRIARKINEQEVDKIKNYLSKGTSIREAARLSGVSFSTAWHVSKGTYDTNKPLKEVFKKESEFFIWN